jgi:hypothetical protein
VRLARPDLVVAGVDERSALVRDPDGHWTVQGAGSASLFRAGAPISLDALRDLRV